MCKDVYVFAEQRDGNLQKVGIELIGETIGSSLKSLYFSVI